MPPRSAAKVRNGPRPAKRVAAEATLRALNSLHQLRLLSRRAPEVSLHRPPRARSSRSVPHSPPTLARSDHPVGCHAARTRAKLRRACRAASGAPANSMALGAPHRRRRCSRPRPTQRLPHNECKREQLMMQDGSRCVCRNVPASAAAVGTRLFKHTGYV